MARYAEFVEPDENGQSVTITTPFEQAVVYQRSAASTKGYIYPNDEMAFQDYLVVHWGYEVER